MKRLKIILQSNLFYIILSLILIIFIFINTNLRHYSSSFNDKTKKIIARIESFTIDGDKISFYFKEKEKFVATYYLKSEKEKKYFQNNLKIGLKVLIEGEKNDLQNNTIPNTFNYRKYLYNKKIYFSFLINKITITNQKISKLAQIKNLSLNRIEKLNNNPYLKAFILGDKDLMPQDISKVIQNNGVSHLFALSGMHLSFIYEFLNKILKKLKFKKIIIYSFLLFYLGLASFPISFIRAFLFTVFLDFNKSFDISISKIKILYLVAIITLFSNPFYIYDIGFIYTFIITFSLLFCSNLLKVKNKILQIGIVSIITFLFSAPITIFINYELNLSSIINNIILVPFVSIIIFPLAILTFFLSFFLPIFEFITTILGHLNIFLHHFSCPIIFGKINIFEVLIYYVLLCILVKYKSKLLVVIFLIYLLFLYNKNIFIKYYSVYYLDVGQGDASLLVSPQNKEVILIDTGGQITYEKESWQKRNKEYNVGETIIQFLKSKRIRKIDFLLLTHGDLDHIGYANYLVDNIKIKKVMINNDQINSFEKNIIQKVPQVFKYQSPYFIYKNLNKLKYDNENDNSLISYFQIYNYQFLFMGDASKKVELDLLAKYSLKIDFLKLGHHGSKTSSDEQFLKEVSPQYAIISAGRNNRYNHPSSETINLLQKYHLNILNTQKHGTIEIRITKEKYHISLNSS